MTLKLLAGFMILVIALALQFWFASGGWYLDLSFAALITFAFIFDIWQFIILILVAVFIINWQPAVSGEILVFSLYPVAVHYLKYIVRWEVWVENLAAILIGSVLMYFVAGHGTIHAPAFFIDAFSGMLFGTAVLLPLYRWQ